MFPFGWILGDGITVKKSSPERLAIEVPPCIDSLFIYIYIVPFQHIPIKKIATCSH